MANSRWLKSVPNATPNVSMADVKRAQAEKAARESGQPVTQLVVDQLPTLGTQLTGVEPSAPIPPLVNQLPSEPVNQTNERLYPSRTERRQVGLRLPVNKIKAYKRWCLDHDVDLQNAVERAMDWLTSQPANQPTSHPVTQLPTLINNDSNNQLIINDEKAKRISERYAELTGRKFNANDLEAHREVAGVDLTLTLNLMGVVMDRARRAGSQVNGFRYFVRDILRGSQQMAQPLQPEEKRDYSACLDCRGSGFYYPEGVEKGVSKCQHSKL